MSDLLKSAESILDILTLSYLERKTRQYRQHRDRQPMVVFAHDFIGNEIGVRGRYEDAELRALTPIIRRLDDGAVLDIGANIGNHTLFFSESFREVHAFEPNPRTLKVLRLNTAELSQVTVHDYGLSDQSETLSALVPVMNLGGASIGYHGGRSPGEVEKQTFELKCYEDVSAEIVGPITLVKIDVEGHEPQVIRGLGNMLRKQQPLVLFEHNGKSMDPETTKEVPSLLRSMGYDQFHAFEKVRVSLPDWIPKAVRWPVRGVEMLLRREGECRMSSVDTFINKNYTVVIASVNGKHRVQSGE